MTRKITHIVMHCAATPNGRPFRAHDIDAWHRDRGFRRTAEWRSKWQPQLVSIGYHYVIEVDGALRAGRHIDEVGAQVKGHNSTTIGICIIGTTQFTPAQWATAAEIVTELRDKYPSAKICGHRDFPGVAKLCPGFDVAKWVSGGLEPMEGHIL